MTPEILLETSDILVVDKPTGISVHNNEDPQNLLKLLGGSLFPIHRLDKETSGIQIFAKSSVAAQEWAHEFQSKQVKKIYSGLVRGQFKSKSGTWSLPLTDKAEGRKSPQGSSRERIPCETQYHTQRSNKYFSFIEFDLKTGRQHQIRKHCALAGHALVGDPRYGDPKYNRRIFDIYKVDRLFLHCQEIEIKKHRILSPVPLIFLTLAD